MQTSGGPVNSEKPSDLNIDGVSPNGFQLSTDQLTKIGFSDFSPSFVLDYGDREDCFSVNGLFRQKNAAEFM